MGSVAKIQRVGGGCDGFNPRVIGLIHCTVLDTIFVTLRCWQLEGDDLRYFRMLCTE